MKQLEEILDNHGLRVHQDCDESCSNKGTEDLLKEDIEELIFQQRQEAIDEYFHAFQKDIGDYQIERMERKQPVTTIPIEDLILLIGVTANRLKKIDVDKLGGKE